MILQSKRVPFLSQYNILWWWPHPFFLLFALSSCFSSSKLGLGVMVLGSQNTFLHYLPSADLLCYDEIYFPPRSCIGQYQYLGCNLQFSNHMSFTADNSCTCSLKMKTLTFHILLVVVIQAATKVMMKKRKVGPPYPCLEANSFCFILRRIIICMSYESWE